MTADELVLPPQWSHLHPRDGWNEAAAAATRLVQGTPAPPYSRAAIHARVAAKVYAGLGFSVSVNKTQIGSKIATLGLRANADQRQMDCIPHKAAAMKAEALALARDIIPGGLLDGRRLERFAGRVNWGASNGNYLPQVECRSFLHHEAPQELGLLHERRWRQAPEPV